jgi:hypothetical protein
VASGLPDGDLSDYQPTYVTHGGKCHECDSRRRRNQVGADLDAATLLTSEIVTNAVQHTKSGVDGGSVTIVVPRRYNPLRPENR